MTMTTTIITTAHITIIIATTMSMRMIWTLRMKVLSLCGNT